MAAFPLSRREVLGGSISVTVGAGTAGVLPAAASEAAKPEQASGAPTHHILLRVNGSDRALEVELRMTLAEVLRGPLGLTGTKIGCNRGACSACTVWLEGEPVCSCTILAVEASGRDITTIEGLARGDDLHPVQEAFLAHDAMQCGFCTPGMAMSAAALVEQSRDPTAEDVERAISGHICRCGTYPHVVSATLAAAKARRG